MISENDTPASPNASFNSLSSFRPKNMRSPTHNSHTRVRTRFSQVKNMSSEVKIEMQTSLEIHSEAEDENDKGYFDQDEDDYFEDDQQTVRKIARERRHASPYSIFFKPMAFFEFFILHVIYFFLLGPLIGILAPIVGLSILRNQGFIKLNWTGLNQFIQYATIMSFIVSFYLGKIKGLQATEVYMLVTLAVIRIITISTKYAYKPDIELRRLHEKEITSKELINDLIAFRWEAQTEEVIQEELQTAILRIEIDSSMFFFHFAREINPALRARLGESKLKQGTNSPRLSIQLKEAEVEKLNPTEPHLQLEMSGSINKEAGKKLVSKLFTSTEHGHVQSTANSQKRGWDVVRAINDPSNKRTVTVTPITISSKDDTLPTSASEIFKIFTKFLAAKKLNDAHLYGYNLAFDLIRHSKKVRYTRHRVVILILSLVRASIPTLYRVYLVHYKKENIPIFTSVPYIIGLLYLKNVFFFWINVNILFISVSDMT